MSDSREALRWRRADLWILLGVVILALGLRFWDLTGESLWYDEAYSVWTSSMEIASPRTLWDWRIEFPLYYWLLHWWIRALGSGEYAVRALGAVAGALTVVSIYYLGRDLFGRQVGALVALLLAVNPYHIYYSQEVRMYALATLFAVASLYAFWRAVSGGHWPWWVAHALLTGLGFYLHYYIGWLLLAEDVYCFVWLARLRQVQDGRSLWRDARPWLLGQLAIVLLAIPAIIVFLTKLLALNQWGWLTERYGAPSVADVVSLLMAYTMGLGFPGPGWLRWLILGLFGGLALWGLLQRWPQVRHGRPADGLGLTLLTLVLPLGLVFILGQFASVWVPRYLLLFVTSLLLLVAVGVASLRPKIAAVAGALLVVASLYGWGGMLTQQQKEDWRGLTAYLIEEQANHDLIVLMDEECRVPFDYYYRQDGARVEVSRFADGAMLDQAVAEIRQKRQGERIWLVVSHADGAGLRARISALPGVRSLLSPRFVGIELAAYERP